MHGAEAHALADPAIVTEVGWMLARTNLIFVGVLVLVTLGVFIWRYRLD
jgi:hypothetical protein